LLSFLAFLLAWIFFDANSPTESSAKATAADEEEQVELVKAAETSEDEVEDDAQSNNQPDQTPKTFSVENNGESTKDVLPAEIVTSSPMASVSYAFVVRKHWRILLRVSLFTLPLFMLREARLLVVPLQVTRVVF